MKKDIFTLAIFLFVCLAISVQTYIPWSPSHTATSQVVKPKSTTTSVNTQGSFYLSQKEEEGRWVEKYRESFTTTYQTKTFSFTQFNHGVTLQIVQKNIPFGDIEYIKMSACGKEIEPSYAKYVANGQDVLFEIAHDDHNVIVMHEKPIEIHWNINPTCTTPVVVSLKANEYTSDPELPLRFPLSPLSINPRYWYGNNAGKVRIDGNIEEVDGHIKAQYSPWWKPATGHPSNIVHFYLMDDEEYVYIFADITIDNTDEYGEDWFQFDVYNAVETSPLGFRITDLDPRHGACGFDVTSKASYRHQTCEARISKSLVVGNYVDFGIQYYGTAGANSEPQISLCTFEPYPLIGSWPSSCTGIATDLDGTITSVEYDLIYVETGETVYSDVLCDAQDGEFDSGSEEFICAIAAPLTSGQYQIHLYPTDNYPSTSFEFDSLDVINPPTISGVTPSSGSIVTIANPTIAFNLNEVGQCRASFSDEAYADMNDDIDCSGDGTQNISCIVPDWGELGAKQVYIACSSEGGADTISSNTLLTYTYVLPSPTPTPTITPTGIAQPIPTLEPLIVYRLNNGFDANGECVAQKPGGAPHVFRIDTTDTMATLYIAPPSKPYTTFYITYREIVSNVGIFRKLFEHTIHAESPEYAIHFNREDNGGVVVYTINALKPQTRYEFTVKCSHLCAFATTGNTLGASTNREGVTSPQTYFASNINPGESINDLNMLASTGMPIIMVLIVGAGFLVAAIALEESSQKESDPVV